MVAEYPKKADQTIVSVKQEQELSPEGMKMCQSSYHEGSRFVPADAEHFYRNAGRWDGWSSVCRVCWQKQKADAKARQDEEQAKQAVKGFISLARSKQNVPHMTELVEVIYSKLNGAEGFVDLFIDDILAANPGSPHRLRAEEAIIHLTVRNTEAGHAQKPIELYTDEELAEYIAEQTRTIEQGQQKAISAPQAEYSEADDDATEDGSQ